MPKLRPWWSNVILRDLDTGEQIGSVWTVEVQAKTRSEARNLIVSAAWKDVDSRISDCWIELIDGGPLKVAP